MTYNPASITLLRRVLKTLSDQKIDEHVKTRLSSNFADIYEMSARLFDQHDQEKVLSDMIKKLISLSNLRPVSLKKIDLEREEKPDWFLSEKLAGMMLYVDLFSGDLKNFRKKIDYFEELGINLVHLMPLLQCPEVNNDGGYAVSDFKKVNPKLGTMKDIQAISKEFREKGMYLMLDLAVNHTSDEHEWAQRARKGEKRYQDYYYFFDNREVPAQFEESLPEVFPETAPGNFTYIEEAQKWVMTVFHSYQWDLNYTNPEVFLEMLENLIYLANQGVDIIRLDALAFTWKKIGTDSQNLEEAHLLIKLFKACAQVVAPGVLFLAEAIVAPEQIIKYFGETHTVSNECDFAYNATLMTLLWEAVCTKNSRLLQTSLHNIPQKPLGTSWLNYIRCHDDIGLGYEDLHASWAGYNAFEHRRFITNFLTGKVDFSFASGREFMVDPKTGNARISGSLASLAGLEKALQAGDKIAIEFAVRRILLLHAIIISYGGIPHIYMGDELAMTNDYSFLDHPDHRHDNRWMHRPTMDWKKAELRKKANSLEGTVFNGIKRMLDVRKKLPEFADHNNTTFIDCRNQHIFAYERAFGEKRTFCVFNLNDHPEPLYPDLPASRGLNPADGLWDAVTGQEIDTMHYNILLEPYTFYWLKSR